MATTSTEQTWLDRVTASLTTLSVTMGRLSEESAYLATMMGKLNDQRVTRAGPGPGPRPHMDAPKARVKGSALTPAQIRTRLRALQAMLTTAMRSTVQIETLLEAPAVKLAAAAKKTPR